MQGCFREHPDVYGAELEDDEDQPPLEPETVTPHISGSSADATSEPLASSPEPSPSSPPRSEESDSLNAKTERARGATEKVSKDYGVQPENEQLIPKAAHDATAFSSKTEK